MAYEEIYERINWVNELVSKTTPLNEVNLNKMDYALKEIDKRVVNLHTVKAEQSDLLQSVNDVTLDEETGIITITKANGTVKEYDLNIEKIPVKFTLDYGGNLTMTTDDGTEFTVNLSKAIPVIEIIPTDTIEVMKTIDTAKPTYQGYRLSIPDGAITESKLNPNYLADIKANVSESASNAQSALNSSTEASNSASNASQSATDAEQFRNEALEFRNQAENIVGIDIATSERVGLVKPDGTTILIDADGTIHAVGGSGGTSNYKDLLNKPSINGVSLIGALSLSDLGISAPTYNETLSILNAEG